MKIYNERHEVRDISKYNSLMQAMQADGWQGAALVAVSCDGETYQLLNGSHRIAAARDAEVDAGIVDYIVSEDVYTALVDSCDDDEIAKLLQQYNLTDIYASFIGQ